jgi:hypothetical protein
MSVRFWISKSDLEQLYKPEDHAQIACLLKVQSVKRRDKLRKSVFKIARDYDDKLNNWVRRPLNSATRSSLEDVQKHVRALILALEDCTSYAQWDVARALALAHPTRKFSSGEPILPYGHPLSNEALFERECFLAFGRQLTAIDDTFLKSRIEKLKSDKGGRRVRPERRAVESLIKLWKKNRGKEPTMITRGAKYSGDFIDLCELVLRPIANLHEVNPKFGTHAKNLLYGRNSP